MCHDYLGVKRSYFATASRQSWPAGDGVEDLGGLYRRPPQPFRRLFLSQHLTDLLPRREAELCTSVQTFLNASERQALLVHSPAGAGRHYLGVKRSYTLLSSTLSPDIS
jgi:hypothetical protein